MKPLLIILLFASLIGFGVLRADAANPIDSLKSIAASFVSDTTQKANKPAIDAMIKLGDEYYESFPDSSLYYSKLALSASQKINYQKGAADAYTNIADVNTFHGDYASAEANFIKALNIYNQTQNTNGRADAYIGLGRVQDFLGHYDKAISYFDSALIIRKKLHNESDIAECLNTIGITYDNKGDFAKALDCYFKALVINLRLKNELAAADNYCNIGTIMQHLELYGKALNYFNTAKQIWTKLNDKQGTSTIDLNIGEVMLAQKKYPEAKTYFDKAAAVFKKMDDREGISLAYYDMGLYYYYTHHLAQAINYLQQSLTSASDNKIRYNKAYAYLGLAQVYNLEHNFYEAYNYAQQAQNTANTLGSIHIQADAARQTAVALAGLKQFDKAYAQQALHLKLRDSIKNSDILQKLSSYNLEIAFEQKQKEIVDRQKEQEKVYQQKIVRQQNLNLIYVVIILIIGIMAVIYYNGRRKQEQINTLLTFSNAEVLKQKADLNEQADKLNDLNTLKDRLIAILAHDLRAPISTLRGLFGLLTDSAITQEEFVTMLPRVLANLDQTSDFLDTLIHWVNSQANDPRINVRSFKLADLARKEAGYLEEMLKQKDITLDVDVPEHLYAFGDPNSVRIVLHNFLTNAIKFSRRDSSIKITGGAESTRSIVSLKVTDQGVGMTENQLKNLFKTKVNSTAGTEHETGTGMGLMFCKDLIEKYGGVVTVVSVLGAGTEMGFSLPVGEGE